MNSIYHIPVTIYTNNGNYKVDIPTYYVEDEDIPGVVNEWLQDNEINYISWEIRR